MRAVVDTNVWVSAILNSRGWPAKVLAAYRDGLFELVASEGALDQLREVLLRPRIAKKYGVTSRDADELVALLRERAIVVPLLGETRVCRDPDDDLMLEMALTGRADVVVSRDEDITRHEASVRHLADHGVRVMTAHRFVEELRIESLQGDQARGALLEFESRHPL